MDWFFLSKQTADMQPSRITELLHTAYWAAERDSAVIRLSMANSLCFGAFLTDGGRQIAFARVITDQASSFYLCDVIVDESYRGRGVGRSLVAFALSDERIARLRGILATRDQHALYEAFGFRVENDRLMGRSPAR